METSFCELKGKDVINIVDGKKLGKIIDIVFNTQTGRMLGVVVPSYNKSWNIFKSSDDIFIPFGCICKFGDDAILVQIFLPNQKENFAKKGKFVRTANAVNPNEYQNIQAVSTPQNISKQSIKNTEYSVNNSHNAEKLNDIQINDNYQNNQNQYVDYDPSNYS